MIIRCRGCQHYELMKRESSYCRDCFFLEGMHYAPREETMIKTGTKKFSFIEGIAKEVDKCPME